MEGARHTELGKLFEIAFEANDKELLASGTLASGDILFDDGCFGKAAARFELAAELYRELGNTAHELKALDRLAQSYKELKYEKGVSESLARKGVILESLERRGEQNVGVDESENRLGNLFAIFGSSSNAPLKKVEVAKDTMRELHSKFNDTNEQFLQTHLMQVHLSDLPFEVVRLRMEKQALMSIGNFLECVKRLCASMRSFSGWSSEHADFGDNESAGSLHHAMDTWTGSNYKFSTAIESRLDEIMEGIAVPLMQLRSAMQTIIEFNFHDFLALRKRENEAKKFFDLESTNYSRALAKLQQSEERQRHVRHGSPRSKPKTLSESMGDILSGGKSPEARADENVRRATVDVQQLESTARDKGEKAYAAVGARRAAWRRICREFEMLEQTRINMMGHLLVKLCTLQQGMLDEWKSSLFPVVEASTNVDAASDLRAFSNHSLIRAVASGKLHPSSLHCSPTQLFSDLDKYFSDLRFEVQKQKPSSPSPNTEADNYSSDKQLLMASHSVRLRDDLVGTESDTASSAEETITSEEVKSSEDKWHHEVEMEKLTARLERKLTLPGLGGETFHLSELELDVQSFMKRLEANNESVMENDEGYEARSSADVVTRLCEGFRFRSVRADFLRKLNRFRSIRTSICSDLMNDLMLLMIAFLNNVYIQGDVRAAKMILILSETFHSDSINDASKELGNQTEVGRVRHFVQDGIKEHSIWKSIHFWEETFFLALREEIYRNASKFSRDAKPYQSSDHENIAYGQIGSSAFNMLSVGLPRENVQKFIERMCVANGIGATLCAGLSSGLFQEEPDVENLALL